MISSHCSFASNTCRLLACVHALSGMVHSGSGSAGRWKDWSQLETMMILLLFASTLARCGGHSGQMRFCSLHLVALRLLPGIAVLGRRRGSAPRRARGDVGGRIFGVVLNNVDLDKSSGWCPVAAVQIVMDWLGKLLNLPESFLAFNNEGKRGLGGGVIQVPPPVSPYLAHRLQARDSLAN